MDRRLVAWARAVKRRHASPVPPLWLFTDPARLPNPAAAVAALPRGLCGVVFRHDGVPARAALAAQLARCCRQRRLAFSIAGAPLRLPGTLRHLREGRGRSPRGWSLAATASAHGVPGLVLARRAKCQAVFLSPLFTTASHPGAAPLGLMRWLAIARTHRATVLALGGIDGKAVRRLPRWVNGVGAIGALLPG